MDSHCSEGNLAMFLLQERGCMNNPWHQHNKSPYSWEVHRQIFTSPRYGEVDRQICLYYFKRADLPSLWISFIGISTPNLCHTLTISSLSIYTSVSNQNVSIDKGCPPPVFWLKVIYKPNKTESPKSSP